MRCRPFHPVRSARRGSLVPMVLASLVVVLGCAALVLDMLWLEGAGVELRRTAEAAALAAGRELASDDLLKANTDFAEMLDRAGEKAASIAAENYVAGQPLALNIDRDDSERDLRFGKDVFDDEQGRYVFVETSDAPNKVRARGERSRSRWNPVALFLRGVSGQDGGDVIQTAEASLDNRVTGLRPYDGVPVPALPLAILQKDPTFLRKDTWDLAIENRQGNDLFGFNSETGEVTQQPDGIPEITLRSMATGGKPSEASVLLIDLNTDLRTQALANQIRTGWTVSDLARLDGQLDFLAGPPTLVCGAVIGQDVATELESQIGQPRIVLLYQNHQSTGSDGFGTCTAVRPVAGRIMTLDIDGAGACRIVFQPAVVTTRTAVLARESGVDDESVEPNPYIYKLQITH